jgi:hypothetical protein
MAVDPLNMHLYHSAALSIQNEASYVLRRTHCLYTRTLILCYTQEVLKSTILTMFTVHQIINLLVYGQASSKCKLTSM